MKKFAILLSYVLHPLFAPIIGISILFNSGTYIGLINNRLFLFLYTLVALFTIFLPLLVISILVQLRVLKNLYLEERKERIIPYMLTFIFYAILFIFLKKEQVPHNFPIWVYILGCSISVLFMLIITYFWKISSHMIGIGGITALILSISFVFRVDLMFYLIICLTLSGLLGSSRLLLNKHNLGQVLTGYFLGFITILSISYIYFVYY